MGRADQHHSFAEAIFGLLAALLRRAPRDMSLTSLATLSTLDRTGPRRITDLAAIEGIAQPSMTSLVANLERDGLAERRSDPNDKRVALVSRAIACLWTCAVPEKVNLSCCTSMLALSPLSLRPIRNELRPSSTSA